MILILLPFIEAWITGDKREHHLLERPRNAPTRTALMVALMTMYGLFWAAGGNDIIAITLNASINQITYFMRAAVFVGPIIAFVDHPALVHLAAAQGQRDAAARLRDRHHHALPRGRLLREAPPAARVACLHAHRSRPRPGAERPARPTASTRTASPRPPTAGSPRCGTGSGRSGTPTTSQKPTPEELSEGHHHAEHEHELQASLDGHAADGHQFDGHHLVEDEHLRGHTDRQLGAHDALRPPLCPTGVGRPRCFRPRRARSARARH